jgi:hypothetical protein
MASLEDIFTPPRSRFKFVCDRCGSLSIRIADPGRSPLNTPVECARCGAVRGTLGELHELARQGSDQFEF